MLNQSIKNMYKQKASDESSFKRSLMMPKIKKVIVHRSLGIKAQDKKLLKQSIDEIRLITGQQPVITRAKKSIATFKIRAHMPLGIKVTLRGDKMYSFVDRLIHLVLPQVKDFQGLSRRQLDNGGNYNIGIVDQSVFPEIETDFSEMKLGLDITLVTNLTSKNNAEQFLTDLGFPFRDNS